MMGGYLLGKGFKVQRRRVREALRSVDPEGVASRKATAINRRKYSVPTPNSLWHGDANLKLIRLVFIMILGIKL